MKLHLPITLLTALLGAFAAQAVEIPDDYEQIDLRTTNNLDDYTSNTAEDKYAFILRTDLDFTPTTNTTWTSSTPLVDGGNLLFTSADGFDLRALSFSNGSNSVFYQPTTLTFDTLSNLTIKGQGDKPAVDLGEFGTLYIRNVNDGVDNPNVADVLFSGNSMKPDANRGYYGSISAWGYDTVIDISYNGDVVFSGNITYQDGAISMLGGVLNINHNADVTFSANTSRDEGGGAIYSYGSLSICNNGDVSISGNSATATAYLSRGGGIYSYESLSICNNGDVSISGNSATSSYPSYGGGIYSYGSLSICNNGDVIISGNSATTSTTTSSDYTTFSRGGAIYGSLSICNNVDVIISGNSATTSTTTSSDYTTSSSGGAIYGSLSICNNREVIISGNSATTSYTTTTSSDYTTSSSGGAIYGSLSICNNREVIISGNSATTTSSYTTSSCGGAIYSEGSVSICNNGDVGISGNFVSASDTSKGGAIYSKGSLSIVGNDSVTFSKNYERLGDTYRLRSIYMMPDSSAYNLVLAAKTGGHITFYDSVYMGSYSSGETVSFNADYEDADGVTQKAGGDIIFSGKYAAEHLAEIKGAAATTSEITNSRTSEINNLITLYGGSLQVVDGAKLNGRGLTVAADSGAKLVLRDGELNHAGYDITISSGSTLSAVGENTISASTLAILGGGKMHLSLDMARVDSAAVLTTTGNLSMADISLDLSGTEYLVAGDYKLLTRTEGVDYDISGWRLNGATADQLRWEDGTLYYTGGHDWNHGVTDDDDISDLGEILGNLIINGGDITLDDVVNAIQDAVDAGFGHGQGHIVINRGGIHISGAGDLDGHIIFNGDLKDIRKLFIEKDITNIKIELGGNSEAENIVDVGSEYTIEIDELSGDGSMNKTGEGEMVIHSKGNKVGGTLDVQEGKLTFTVGEDSAAGETKNDTEVHELVIGNKEGKEAKVKVDKDAKVKGDKLHVDGKNAVVTNEGSLEFTEEVKVKGGHLDNNGSISKVTLEGGKVSGSGSFAGLEMLGGELVVGNSPGLQTYTDALDLTEGTVTFSLADAGTAATADTHGWGSAAYSTIDMSGNALTIGGKVSFVLEIGGAALESLVAADSAAISFNLSLIQNIDSESLTLSDAALSELLANTSIIITADAEGLTDSTLVLAGLDITSMLSNAVYSYEGNTLVFSGTVTNDGSLSIPEPTTATLSLLALAALAARRRRK